MLTPRQGGLTLIEALSTLAVIAVLAAIAMPSFQASVRKSRRADAVIGLQQLQQAQERWRAEHPAYAGSISALRMAPRSREGHYILALQDASATGYVAIATAAPASPQTGDRSCASLRLTQDGGDTRYASLDAEGIENTQPRNPCWTN